ncbi:hypothetical protein AB3R30_10985 [Leptolyngbyaceae cyanobacterium UHCC 1019]
MTGSVAIQDFQQFDLYAMLVSYYTKQICDRHHPSTRSIYAPRRPPLG